MVEQLVNLEGDFDGMKIYGFILIYNKFKKDIQYSQQCKLNLVVLEIFVENLKSSIILIFEIVDEMKNEIYKLLYQLVQLEYCLFVFC